MTNHKDKGIKLSLSLIFYLGGFMASIKIETGLKTYDIEDEHGNIRGQITLNPKDIGFFQSVSWFFISFNFRYF